MVHLTFRRKLSLLVLALALLAPWPAQAVPLGSPPAEPLGGLIASLTEWFTAWFGDVGCSMDPSGICRDTNGSQLAPPADTLDVGCSMDPGGRCHDTPTVQGDIGCSADPDGRCRG